jgi:hypothetical protein
MSAHPNNTPAQKKAWRATRKLVSRFGSDTPSYAYHPEPKVPSRRDRHRAIVAAVGHHRKKTTLFKLWIDGPCPKAEDAIPFKTENPPR